MEEGVMIREFPRRNLERLKKEAKHWLAELRRNAGDARARLERALPSVPASPTLRDVQLALAREQGFPGWTALKRALTPDSSASRKTLDQYEDMAAALLEAYRTGTPEAMERHYRYTWHRRAWSGMRTYVQLDLGKRASGPDDPVDISLDDARYLVAIEHGFENWDSLVTFVSTMPGHLPITAKPVRVRSAAPSAKRDSIAVTRDWQTALRLTARTPSPAIDAHGQMTDAMLLDLSNIEELTALDLSGSHSVTDDGIRHLAKLTKLRHLDLSGTAITDLGLDVLRNLPALETISLAGTRVTDSGAAHLSGCHELRDVNLGMTRTGDGAIRALAGKAHLRQLRTGNAVTDEGLAVFHDYPAFKSWRGGDATMALLSYDAGPNLLSLRGTFGDRGMSHLKGLDGLFALNVNDGRLGLTAAGLAPLVTLPHLGWLAVDARDDLMPIIAELPYLRFLGAQDTPAGDDGFVELSRSKSIEYIWGRRCHNLQHRGFVALARMPALRALSVSCLNVDDAGISALPGFPALRELMPMDIPDAGYRHIGQCLQLESLILMYCRDTTDAATEHLEPLRNLTDYFNSYTTITDRTPAILSEIDSLERITFDTCHGLTDAGIAKLARLPRLRELRVSGKGVSDRVQTMFPEMVAVNRD
jgi:hypothetical protein